MYGIGKCCCESVSVSAYEKEKLNDRHDKNRGQVCVRTFPVATSIMPSADSLTTVATDCIIYPIRY